jgi:hypothetical protein
LKAILCIEIDGENVDILEELAYNIFTNENTVKITSIIEINRNIIYFKVWMRSY